MSDLLDETKKLLYRRQFVLGPFTFPQLSHWQNAKICNDYVVQSHPDLTVTQVEHHGIQITLLGYILDPNNTDDTDLEILKKLVVRIKSTKDAFKETYSFGGRWILIVSDETDVVLFHDPCGMRQVVYLRDCEGKLWCASQPSILAQELKLEIDPEAVTFLKNTKFIADEYWYPGNVTSYKIVKQLLPNHYLDFNNCQVHRFWPHESLGSISIKQGAVQCAFILKALILSANNRFQLALPLTAGMDSRVIYAACKDIKEQVFHYTLLYRDLTDKSADINIPRKLLKKNKLTHHLIDC